jgi:antirestriction protein ArdC
MLDVYKSVTDRILKQLEAGQIPWRKTWSTGIPKSLTTGKEYRGLNVFVLGTASFGSRYWLTYRQAQRLGGHVRKGETATPVIYWKWRTAEDIRKAQEKTGRETVAPCFPFLSCVFNLDQVEGVGRPDDDIQHREGSRLELAENVFAVMPDKPEIVHATIAEPAYSRLQDRVTLPNLSQFESADEYFATLYHELTHSTGHSRRLNRFAKSDGDRIEKYSFEELVAEFGAAFLCAFAGISDPLSEALQASYIEGWSRVFRQDSRILIRAAAAAQRAADYIRGKVIVDQDLEVAA